MQYLLITNLYMFEPWEKKLINSFIGVCLFLILFSSFVYLPKYTQNLFQLLSFGNSGTHSPEFHQEKMYG
uniref:Serine palmitoyltransferase small subunit B n=1 Tax=Megaselia scalaris TaxID=36166 RepID=T1H2R2_MEGSC